MPESTSTPVPGWEDIAGIFEPFTAQMMWRFNLGSYEDVRANASIIASRIGVDMPPLPFPPLSQPDIDTFNAWVAHGCPQARPVAAG
ncbi:MAG TPA: hypothetical protein VF584_05845 [Longimicrobium sp.]|jgi:hypothetical protein